METNDWMYIIGVVIAIWLSYLAMRYITKEGFEGQGTTVSVSSGIGERSSSYNASIKSRVIQGKDRLLVDKYRTEYEEIIVQADELIDQMILQETLTLGTDPMPNIARMAELQKAKEALNSAISYIN